MFTRRRVRLARTPSARQKMLRNVNAFGMTSMTIQATLTIVLNATSTNSSILTTMMPSTKILTRLLATTVVTVPKREMSL